MALIVQKFGGSSVADRERLFNAARIIAGAYNDKNRVVAVVSAQGDTTDLLLGKAGEISPHPGARELDMLLSTGEQSSAALLCMALLEIGVRAVSLTGWQAGFETDRLHTRARIRRLDTERVSGELDKNQVVVVTGFQGLDRCGDITTLGRGGSDTSAVALACALGAQRCCIYTDVDGVYTADPRRVPGARRLEEISFDEMLELAGVGAQVLHGRSVELARRCGMELEVLSSLQPGPGTRVKEACTVEGLAVKSVAADAEVTMFSLRGSRPDMAVKVAGALAARHLSPRLLAMEASSMRFTLPDSAAPAARELFESRGEALGVGQAEAAVDLACLSAVGSGLRSDPTALPCFLEALADVHIPAVYVSGSEVSLCAFVPRTEVRRAVSAVHSAFFGSENEEPRRGAGR